MFQLERFISLISTLIISTLHMRNYDYRQSMGFIIKNTAKSLERAMDFELGRRAGITVSQSRVIGALALTKDGMTQREIADRLGIEGPTLVPIIDRMEKQGLIQRKPDPADRRNNLIFMTKKSEHVWDIIIDSALHIRKISQQGIPADNLDITKSVLGTISQNLGEYLEKSAKQETANVDLKILQHAEKAQVTK